MNRTAEELAQFLGAKLVGEPLAEISGIAIPERAQATDLIYLDSPRQLDRAMQSAAGCVIAPPGMRIAGKTILETPKPKLAFAKAAQWLKPAEEPESNIHPTAVVAANAKIAPKVRIGPFVVVEESAHIGEGSRIEAFCAIGRGASLGEDCWLHPHVTLYAGARLGNRVELHSGVVVGSDGFGYVFGEGRQWKFPQVGIVELEDDVEIGCNTAIDRGSLGETRVGKGVKIDNLVQIAHNVQIGEHCVIAAQTGISGSTVLGKRVSIGGQAGIGDHANIEDDASVGGQAGVLVGKTIRRGETVWGTPARALDKFKEQYAYSAQLSRIVPELMERVRKLEEEQKNMKGATSS